MKNDFDVCVIGSGAGGGPIALEMAKAGKSVVVLEKGPWFSEQDFYKDELACCRRSVYTPELKDEQHVIEKLNRKNSWESKATSKSGWDFWNGNCVGGSSNFMSGFFYRLKPEDFRLLSEFGPIAGANIVDWPIDYTELEPYYTKVETEVGVSGRVVKHTYQEPRSTDNFPYPPMIEHPMAQFIDQACQSMGVTPLPVPRAILTLPKDKRRSCEYSGYCGSFGCSSGAKGSSRAALLDNAVATGYCEIRPHAKVYKLISNKTGKVIAAEYFDAKNNIQEIKAKIFVVACQAIETARLLLYSTGPKYENGLGNRFNQVGKNLIFSAGGSGQGDFAYTDMEATKAALLKVRGPFVNRGLQDWYFINETKMGGRLKGGVIDFLLRHPNPIAKAMREKSKDSKLVWGRELQKNLKSVFTDYQYLRYEVFCDWLPTDNCFVSLDKDVKDKWNTPVAKVRVGHHEHDLKIGNYLSDKAKQVLKKMGAVNIKGKASGSPPQNLVAGGCRFGNDPKSSVLDKDCRIHDAENVYVTDGSFMPTGGSVPHTWTIYANAFRVADIIKKAI
ncbi:MAG: GMC family oxidoreductase [Gammaproteobacteria bacterium]|nr:GMC family oxidoreductase [Gammaproteobacteria bacterium]